MTIAMVDAEGAISLAEQHVANMLADSAQFRAWCHATSGDEARRRIHFDALPPPAANAADHTREELEKCRPFALILTSENSGYRKTRVGTTCYAESGSIGLQLEQDVDSQHARNNALLMRQFKNFLGLLIDELDSLAYQGGYLAFDAIELVAHGRIEEDQVPTFGDTLEAMLLLTWGVTS